MDLYNFYRGLENVIDTLQKDRHDLTMKDYLIMCDPFFNVDFYDEKYLNRQIGGASEKDVQEIKTSLKEGSDADRTQAAAAETEIQKGQEEKKADAEKEAKEAAEAAKKAATEEEAARKTMKEKGKEMKKLVKEFKKADKAVTKATEEQKNAQKELNKINEKNVGKDKKKDTSAAEAKVNAAAQKITNKTNEKNAKGTELAKVKSEYLESKGVLDKAKNEKQSAESKAESSKAISDEDVADAAADLDKEVDEMAPIKNLIKTATKVVVIFAMIVCLPIVPWILISFYSFKKLHGLYISYIQTY